MAASSSRLRRHSGDLAIVLLLALAAAAASFLGSRWVDSSILPYDVWFGSDTPRIIANMSERASNHYRTKVHPLFSILTWPPVYALKSALGIWGLTAIRLVIAAVAALWVVALYTLFRLIGCRRLDASVFTALAASSAAAVFWLVVPETYAFGALTIALALCVVAWAQRHALSERWYIGVVAMTMSVTITNLMVGAAAAFAQLNWRRAVQVVVNGFCIVVLLWAVQKYVFPNAAFFLGDREEEGYVNVGLTATGAIEILRSFFFHSMVMPEIQEALRGASGWPWLVVQKSLSGSAGPLGQFAVLLWTLLMGLGGWALVRLKSLGRLRAVLAAALAGQLILHLLYGEETFLYALHFGPLLVVMVALGSLTRARWLVLSASLLLIVAGGWNNLAQLGRAVDFVEAHRSAHSQVQRQMSLRPSDPWPRSVGHVVLGTPGSREVDKAYHEPGGSFSPAVGSFGVSIWVTDDKGAVRVHSDNLPLAEISQRFEWNAAGQTPGIGTSTAYYDASWLNVDATAWRLDLTPKSDARLTLAVRSVGPAGGPVHDLKWDGRQLLVNGRWTIAVEGPPAQVRLGSETRPGGLRAGAVVGQVHDGQGWGFALLEFTDRAPVRLVISDGAAARPSSPGAWATKTRSGIRLDLPDERFAASLDAQVAHLMMSIVDRETRPGDPVYYPLAWQRDGAYSLVALARSGHLSAARELSEFFAKNDFFGGFGAEADAPGLSIWALEEVAVRIGQRDHDAWLWPHVRRKAGQILEMLAATQQVRHRPFGPVEPEYSKHPQLDLVAEAAKDGLIVGRMDWGRPLLFVNAVSFRGLQDAAAMADRLGHVDDARRWRDRAVELQRAWKIAFDKDRINNDRTYIATLWPTWVADSSRSTLLERLEQRWQSRRDAVGGFKRQPEWTYFEVAEAHQWLMLGKPERARQTLEWFWRNQSSPGLYTWWEGSPAPAPRWQGVRGWVKPNPVTPHYWTAAEVLLLQLNMLGYLDASSGELTVVIGAGIPADWLSRPMSVAGLSLPDGPLDWRWDGRQMQVWLPDPAVRVRLGTAFPAASKVQVHAGRMPEAR